MYCVKCGRAHGDTDRYCSFCGSPIEANTSEKLDTPPVEEQFELKRDQFADEYVPSFVEEQFDLKRSDASAKMAPSPVEREFDLKRDEASAYESASPISFVSPIDTTPDVHKDAVLSRGKSSGIVALVFASFAIAFLFVAWLNWAVFASVIPVAVVSIVFGVRAIKAFTQLGRMGADRPASILVFGIIGVALSAVSLFIYAIYLFMFALAIGMAFGW